MPIIDVIYRAMEEESGMPKIGNTAIRLGVRLGRDIVADSSGMVHRPLFLPGQPNGISGSPSILDIPRFALPVGFGGQNNRAVLWSIETIDLGPDLVAEEDSHPSGRSHISIGPARSMLADEFCLAVQATRMKWRQVVSPGA